MQSGDTKIIGDTHDLMIKAARSKETEIVTVIDKLIELYNLYLL